MSLSPVSSTMYNSLFLYPQCPVQCTSVCVSIPVSSTTWGIMCLYLQCTVQCGMVCLSFPSVQYNMKLLVSIYPVFSTMYNSLGYIPSVSSALWDCQVVISVSILSVYTVTVYDIIYCFMTVHGVLLCTCAWYGKLSCDCLYMLYFPQ